MKHLGHNRRQQFTVFTYLAAYKAWSLRPLRPQLNKVYLLSYILTLPILIKVNVFITDIGTQLRCNKILLTTQRYINKANLTHNTAYDV